VWQVDRPHHGCLSSRARGRRFFPATHPHTGAGQDLGPKTLSERAATNSAAGVISRAGCIAACLPTHGRAHRMVVSARRVCRSARLTGGYPYLLGADLPLPDYAELRIHPRHPRHPGLVACLGTGQLGGWRSKRRSPERKTRPGGNNSPARRSSKAVSTLLSPNLGTLLAEAVIWKQLLGVLRFQGGF
jgi:hypothetical protein